MKISQNMVEKFLVLIILVIFAFFFRYSLEIFQGVNYMRDIIMEMESDVDINRVDNFASFYVFLIGMIVCGLILLYPFKNFYAKYGLNKKIFLGKNKKNDEKH